MNIIYNLTNNLFTIVSSLLFICIFFFSYVVRVEQTVFTTNITFTINQLFDITINILPVSVRKIIQQILDGVVINTSSTQNEDDKIKTKNSNLQNKAITIFTLLFIVSFIIVIIVSYIYKFDIKQMIYENLCIVAGIAIIEYVFLETIITKYISSDPNTIIYTASNQVSSIINSNIK